jgi:hypothetical protein
MGDGSFTDENDEDVKLQPGDRIRLAHQMNAQPEKAQAWIQHLADFNIIPPFRQFGGHRFVLSEKQGEQFEINDFNGHMVLAFTLREILTKSGYQRGSAEDHGHFTVYLKRLLGLGVEAEVEFSGNHLPEANREVALLSLRFQKTPVQKADQPKKLRLKDVPPLFLAECVNDLHLVSSSGTGFHSDWESRVKY